MLISRSIRFQNLKQILDKKSIEKKIKHVKQSVDNDPLQV